MLLLQAGWTAPEITEQTHPEYFEENRKEGSLLEARDLIEAGLKTIGLEFMPEKDGEP